MTAKIITIANWKGGVGKTTLAIGIADAFVSEQSTHVSLIDLDPQATASQALLKGNDFSARFQDDKNLHGLLKALLQGERPSAAPYRDENVHFIKGRGGVGLRLYPTSHRMWGLERDQTKKDGGLSLTHAIRQILAHEAKDRRIVIVDCPPGNSITAEAVIRCSDMVLCPVTLERFAEWGMDSFSNYFDGEVKGTSSRMIMRFVITRHGGKGSQSKEMLQRLSARPNMLRVVLGGRAKVVRDDPATFSERQTVRDRLRIKEDKKTQQRPRTLKQIYGTPCTGELVNIVNAILEELGPHG
jgi:cellulose biosynthesis protein BcsQ